MDELSQRNRFPMDDDGMNLLDRDKRTNHATYFMTLGRKFLGFAVEARRRGDHRLANGLFREASWRFIDAAKMYRFYPHDEPSRSRVYYQAIRSCADLGRVAKVVELYEQFSTGNPDEELSNKVEEIMDSMRDVAEAILDIDSKSPVSKINF